MKQRILFFGILVIGILIAGGVLFFPNLFSYKSIASQSPQWTQNVGAGISAPACVSSSASVTCVSGQPSVTISWSGASSCSNGIIMYATFFTWVPAPWVGSGWGYENLYRPCSGSATYSSGSTGQYTAILANSTTYSYFPALDNDWSHQFPGSITNFTTPNCAPTTGTIQGFKVVMPGNQPVEPASSQTVWLNGGSPTTANPYFFTNVTATNHTVSVTVPTGWSVGYTLCYNSTGCHGNTPVGGNSVTVSVPAGGYADLWWHYTPPSPPTASISANPASIPYNTASTISWSSTNATSCTVSPPGWTGTSGSQSTGNLTSSQTYTVNCSGPGGSAPPASATVTVGSPPQTLSVSKSGTGSGTVTSNPTGISCDSDCSESYNYGTSVTLTASPSAGSTFTGWSGSGCSGAGACTVTMTQARSVTATFNLLLPEDFTLNPPSAACNSVSLSWGASTYADAYRILKGSPRVDISPYQPYTALNFVDYSVSQNTDYIYQIEAYNAGGNNRSNARSITTPYCPPTLSFSGSPTSIFEGQSTTLTWSTSFATSCTASGAWSGSKAVNGSQVVIPLPPPSVTYTLTCTGPGGSAGPQSVIVNITPLALPEWKEIIPR